MKKNYLKRFFWPITQDWRHFLLGLVDTLVWGLYPPLVVYFLKEITVFVEQGNTEMLQKWLIYFIVFLAISYPLRWIVKEYFWNGLLVALKGIHRKYIPEYMTIDNNAAEKIGTGKFVSIINKGMDIRADGAANAWFWGITYVVTTIGALFIIAETNFWLSLGTLGFLLFSSLVLGRLDKKAVQRRNKRRDYEHAHTESVVRLVMSKFEVMQSNRISQEVELLDEYVESAKRMNKYVSDYVIGMFFIPNILLDLLRVGLVVIVGYGVIDGSYTFSDFVGILGAVYILESVLHRGIQFFKNTTKNLAYFRKLIDTYDSLPQISGFDTGKEFVYTSGAIQLQDISYAYGDTLVFDDFTLDLQGGKKTALVGISGAGKSTLVKLISGYLQPDRGSIVVDGQKLTDVSLKSYYQHIGYLTQEAMVFDGSVYDNLTYALDYIPSREEVDQIIQHAKCEFVYEFKNGLQTEIGERGIRLSGGQRQRLAIAKIMLKNPQIIILDEPTSALDSFSEEAITQAMHNLFAGRTVIIVAHRLQTVKAADEIIVLGSEEDTVGSRILERGTHDELVSKGGHYAEMLELQTGF